MTQPLDYSRPPSQKPPRLLTYLANGLVVFPLLPILSLYGQWLLSWWILGHPPQPWVDNPKHIDGASWMHPITATALMLSLPAAAAALAFNITYVIVVRDAWRRAAVRALVLFVAWAGTYLLLSLDPGRVMFWWVD
jgi:hypothetical protein